MYVDLLWIHCWTRSIFRL